MRSGVADPPDYRGAFCALRDECPSRCQSAIDICWSERADQRPGLVRHEETLKRIARLESCELFKTMTYLHGTIQIILDEVTIAMSLEGIIDVEAEVTRLTKEIDKNKG